MSPVLSKVLISPLFSAMKTRPLGANTTAVGSVSPLQTTWSRNPVGTVAASAADGWVAADRRRTSPPPGSLAVVAGSAMAATGDSRVAISKQTDGSQASALHVGTPYTPHGRGPRLSRGS
jgi:hypothetical protein